MDKLKPRQLDIMQSLAKMLQAKGPVKVTTASLANECGITEAAIYRHFPSKRKIYEGLVEFCEQSLFDLIGDINSSKADHIEKVSKTSELIKVIDDLKITQDTDRLKNRKRRTGKVALRGRVSKVGKSALFVVSKSENISKAAASIPGIDVCEAKNLSVLNLAPGGTLIRLTVFSKKAIEEIAEIKSRHLELMVTLK